MTTPNELEVLCRTLIEQANAAGIMFTKDASAMKGLVDTIKSIEQVLDGPVDPETSMYNTAVREARDAGRVSISAINRNLRCGYNMAGRIFDRMIADGVIRKLRGADYEVLPA